jgi:predicted enzyme related to lactoylglutathione lyase
MTQNAPGTPCWIELVTPDRDAAVAFYGGLFGWTAGEQSPEFGGYSMFFKDDQPVAGLMPEVEGMTGPPTWAVYLATPDAAKVAELAKERGGSVAVEPMAIADLGSMVVVTDAAGMGHCGWQADTFPGLASTGEVGEPAWFEAYATSFDTARDFLVDVYGWEVHVQGDTDEFRYVTNGAEESATAGLMDATSFGDGFVPGWTFYVRVADMDAAVAKVAELGGTVTQGPDDTPYGLLTEVADPGGQRLKLIVPPAG